MTTYVLPAKLKPLEDALQAIDWKRIESLSTNVDSAFQLLSDATVPGKLNDPASPDSHLVWMGFINALRERTLPTAASFSARWYRHLEAVGITSAVVAANRATAAYMTGVLQGQQGNAASARRWLHIAEIEDARTKHSGAAHTVLRQTFGEDPEALNQLHELVQDSTAAPNELEFLAEYHLTRWYLRTDLRTSDHAQDAEHRLRPEVLRKFIDHANATHATTTGKGNALEILAAYVLTHIIGCYPVSKARTLDFEIDLVVRNLSRTTSPALDILGRYFLVECKNWGKPVGSSHVSYFANRVRYCRATLGILFSKNGITGGTDTASANADFVIQRTFNQDGIVIAVVDEHDLGRLASGTESVLQLLLRKHDEVRFGRWVPDAL